ncbi:MAG: nucleoside-diphosphate kinase [Candidatus Pacearchaeota archaeon]
MTIQQTLVLIKPDGVQRGLVGEAIKRFEQRGLKIVGIKMVEVDGDFSKKHYAELVNKEFYKGLEEYITSGPVIAIVIEGVDAIENVRKIVGTTESKSAQPGTIRGDFSHISYAYADKKKIAVKNLIHASGNESDAKRELGLWFSVDELHDYKRAEEEHVF